MQKLIRNFALALYTVAMSSCVYWALKIAINNASLIFYILAFFVFLFAAFSTLEIWLLRSSTSTKKVNKVSKNSDVVLFVDNDEIESVKIAALSIMKMKGANKPFVFSNESREDLDFFCLEYDLVRISDLKEIETTSDQILVTNSRVALYPDALMVARKQLAENMDIVELNYSKKAIADVKGERNSFEPSIHLDIARSVGSFGIFMYCGSAVVMTGETFKRARKSVKGNQDFSALLSGVISSGVNGTITTHSCCEPILSKEISSTIGIRATNFQVISRLRKPKMNKSGKFRNFLANTYRSLLFIKVWSFIALCLFIPVFLVSADFGHISTTFLSVSVVVSLLLNKINRKLIRDERTFSQMLLDNVLDFEAYLRAGFKYSKHFRSIFALKVKWPVLYIVSLFLAIVLKTWQGLQDQSSITNNWEGTINLIVLIAFGIFVYRSMRIYFSAQQRAFTRRKVSIPGSSSYESMWIVDLTHRGAGYISDSRLDVGDETLLVFSLPNSSDDELLSVVGKVTYCGARQDQYQVGVEFKELSLSTQESLIYYTCVLHPYLQARNFDTQNRAPKDIVSKFRYGFVRDPLNFSVASFSVLLVLFLIVSSMPVKNTQQDGVDISGTLSAVEAVNSDLININIDEVNDSKNLKRDQLLGLDLTENFPVIEIENDFSNLSESGYKRGDKVQIKIVLKNTGTLAATKGIELETKLPGGIRENSLRLLSSQGFMPCGFQGKTLKCKSNVAIESNQTLEVNVEAISDIDPSSSTIRRLISSSAKLSKQDIENHDLDLSLYKSNNDLVIPAAGTASVGGKIFYDVNAKGSFKASDPALEGIQITLLRFDDRNKNGIVDLGEAKTVSTDTSDRYGYFGAAKGSSGFTGLNDNKQYALLYSMIPKGLNASSGGLEIFDPQTQGFEDLSLSDEFEQAKYRTQWFGVTKDQIDLNQRLGLTKQKKDFELKLSDQSEGALSGVNVRLIKWIDFNRDNSITKEEISRASFFTQMTDSEGIATFRNQRDHLLPTKYALQSDVDKKLLAPDDFISPDETNFAAHTSKFSTLDKLESSGAFLFENAMSKVSGSIFADFNSNFKIDDLEHPISGIEVSLIDLESGKILQTLTDSQGRYEFQSIKQGKYYVLVSNENLSQGFDSWQFSSNILSVSNATINTIEPIGMNPSTDLKAKVLRYDRVELAKTTNLSSSFMEIWEGNTQNVFLFELEQQKYQETLLTSMFLLWIYMVALLSFRRKFFQKI